MVNGFTLVDSDRIKKICDYFVETYMYKPMYRRDYISRLKLQVLKTSFFGKKYSKYGEMCEDWMGQTSYLINDGLSEDIAKVDIHQPIVQEVVNLLRIGKKIYLTEKQCNVLYIIENSIPVAK